MKGIRAVDLPHKRLAIVGQGQAGLSANVEFR